MRRDARPLVPEAKPPFSMRAKERPRLAASRAMPPPVMPPPIPAMSNVSFSSRSNRPARLTSATGGLTGGDLLGICILRAPCGRARVSRNLWHELAGVHHSPRVQRRLDCGKPSRAGGPQVRLHPRPMVAADAVVMAEGAALAHDHLP